MPDAAAGNKPVAILGAGSLGRLWGGYLPTGQACFLSRSAPGANGNTQDVLQYRRISPEGQAADCKVPLRALSQIARPDLVIVTTKAGDVVSALNGIMADLNPDVPILLFQNGMGSQQVVAERWPNRPVLAASTTEGANRPDADTLIHAGRGQTWVGGLNTRGGECVEQVLRLLSPSGLILMAEPDIQRRLWDKLVVNAGINAFTAILDCPNGGILNAPFYLDYIGALCLELAAVMAVEVTEPLTANEIRDRVQRVATSTALNTSSMRGDVQQGRRTEIDVINGYIVARGRDAGIATPVNQMLVRRVQELTTL